MQVKINICGFYTPTHHPSLSLKKLEESRQDINFTPYFRSLTELPNQHKVELLTKIACNYDLENVNVSPKGSLYLSDFFNSHITSISSL